MVEKGQQGKVEIEPRREWGFAQAQQQVRNIYFEHDIECEYGPDTMLAKLLGNAATLKQVIRRNPEDFDTIDRTLTKIFIWTATVANAADIDLEKLMEKKFGLGCPHCKQMPCLLTKGEKCERPLSKDHQLPFTSLPRTLDEWQRHLEFMYSNNFAGDIKNALKFSSERVSEEVGELIGSAYRDIERELRIVSFQDGILPWESEMADVMAWSLAVANCLKRIKGGYSIGKSLEEQYEKGCPYCKSPKCICPKTKTFIEELKK